MIAIVFALGCLALGIAYWLYGAFLVKQFSIDPARPTPAHTQRDGVDFVAARSPVLFGHHFSSIAGAGPIVGPITAAAYFGWGPTLAWILIGAIFIGGVHDFASLVMSIRHRARSIAEICRLYLNPVTYRFFLIFIWLALVYVLVVFLDLTAATFAPALAGLEGGAREEMALRGGTVASASIIYIALAIAFGLAVNRGRLSLTAGSFIFVPLVFVGLIAAHFVPIVSDRVPVLVGGDPKFTWTLVLLIYCFVASVTPVWALLQPRDYLSSYLLFACVVFGGLGLLAGGLSGAVAVQQPAFPGVWHHATGGYLFPSLFILVACGAVSGFHSIVASGTTAKQLPDERAARPVAYGGMLTEGVLALIALATVMCVASPGANPMQTFSAGIGQFLAVFGLPSAWGMVFGLLAISTFLLTTLDTCTRLTRYLVEEFIGVHDKRWRYLTTFLTVLPLFFFAFKRFPNPADPTQLLPAWRVIWPAFGTTNQLLAALALLVVMIWRRAQGRSCWFVAWPAAFMLASTTTSMAQLIHQNLFTPGGTPIIGWINIVMMAMTIVLIADTARSWNNLAGRTHEEGPIGTAAAVN
jgi:carbon starvation protein